MHEHRHARKAVGTLGHRLGRPVRGRRQPVLLGPGHPLDDWVHRFEMRRVRGQGDRQPCAAAPLEDASGSLVVLHVARALHRFGVEIPLELLEDLLVRLADDVRQDVEPTTVGHSHHDLRHALSGGGVEQRVEEDDGRLRPLQAEPLLADVARVEEAFEHLGRVQPVQDVTLLVLGEGAGVPFDVLLDPSLLLGVLYVHVLDGEGPAVGVAEHMEDLVECRHVTPGQAVRHEGARQVPDGQPVGQGVEFRVDVRGLDAQRGRGWR